MTLISLIIIHNVLIRRKSTTSDGSDCIENRYDIGAVECRWAIDCDCWYDTDDDDVEESDGCVVQCRWVTTVDAIQMMI
jgi:hypothetical protein